MSIITRLEPSILVSMVPIDMTATETANPWSSSSTMKYLYNALVFTPEKGKREIENSVIVR